jgi:hypothetical protein
MYTQGVATHPNCPPGMTIAYQQPPGGGPPQPVFVLPSGSVQQYYNGANVASVKKYSFYFLKRQNGPYIKYI